MLSNWVGRTKKFGLAYLTIGMTLKITDQPKEAPQKRSWFSGNVL